MSNRCLIDARVRSARGGYVFTGVCLLTGGGEYSTGRTGGTSQTGQGLPTPPPHLPPDLRQTTKAQSHDRSLCRTDYAAGGTSPSFTQQDFRFLKCLFMLEKFTFSFDVNLAFTQLSHLCPVM